MTYADFPFDPLSHPLEPLGCPVPPERLVDGSPQAGVLRIHDDRDVSTGLWEVTPGVFESVKDITEVMHFLSGAGTIEHHDGETTTIRPGTLLVVRPGWRGTWRVTETTRKYFVAYR